MCSYQGCAESLETRDSKLEVFADSKLDSKNFCPTRLETRLELFADSAQPWFLYIGVFLYRRSTVSRYD
ncbi:hypothetical protein Ddc_10819 [Ditylenchus destructor]|nr:hypothetical protein Ddc_10819 [Ditylenchus destructor]